ncbi:vWA domain-containing protein [Blastochloris sulfoviridis]|uniref:VWA domain-containing protein n=1 Tax=Blastochloris sulfoviridis TaxID=50712 RepID=A0A5M6HR89_9HYPH|nr:vWA domain-containing protein [Blastochloris sulfoviridis]KAA5598218.1 VWA domain-containing protein [Blastochloris sulfoviridis]
MATSSLRLGAFAAAALAAVVAGTPARGQSLVEIERLRVGSPAECRALAVDLAGKASGGQWLVGERIDLLGQPNARTPMRQLERAFQKVSCYNKVQIAGRDLVFVADERFETCGWVARSDLLDEHTMRPLAVGHPTRAVCETPRAMLFTEFCKALQGRADNQAADETCRGVPHGLRAKGILTGSASGQKSYIAPFTTAPLGGRKLDTKSFFSVLEIHDVKPGEGGALMALAGDGDGDLFGWVKLDDLQLWPTRLGLFYGPSGRGAMFQARGELIRNWRSGAPPPTVTFDGSAASLAAYIHGRLPLLSYPIIRTVDPARTPQYVSTDPPFHEVVFLGRIGPGSAAQLMAETGLAEAIDRLRRLNVMLVVDTTESMVPYLPLVQQGIMDFISSYWQHRSDPTNRLPEVRISVVAYSDFVDAKRKGLNDPIKTEELVAPMLITPGFDPRGSLARVSAHKGLSDDVGEFSEAAIEAVAQLSGRFDARGWFADAPRVIIHIADHGSREAADVAETLRRLESNKVYYVPIVVVTDDEGDPLRAEARRRLLGQAAMLFSPVARTPERPNLPQVNLGDRERSTSAVVKGQLDDVLAEVVRTLGDARAKALGRDVSAQAMNAAASRIVLSERLRQQYGLDDVVNKLIVQASSGFAPLRVREQGIEVPVDWTYTVALEPPQLDFLALTFANLCSSAGRPEQRAAFRQAIVKLAEAFSGDQAWTDDEIRAILADLATLPGADQSFLAVPVQILLQRIDSTDPEVIEGVKKDVCWIGYHLNNAKAGQYVDPAKVAWTGRDFVSGNGVSAIKRTYLYRPLVGAETVYLPSTFFVLPSTLPKSQQCGFFGCQ